MRLLLVTAGSRGDVEPFVALAQRALQDGHDAQLVAPDNSGADTADVDVVSMGVDYTRLIEAQGVSLGRALQAYRSVIQPLMREVIVTSARRALDYSPDVIVYHPKILSTPLVADRLGVPHALVEIVPAITSTAMFPAAGTVTRGPGWLNRATYRAAAAASGMFRRELDEVRALVGASSRSGSPPTATLMPISSAILRRPTDWPTTAHLTGPWWRATSSEATAADDVADEELRQFLAEGPIVYAGFGSMAQGDPARRGRAIVEAVRARGERLLVATGLGGIAIADELRGADLLVRRSVPHVEVLGRASAAIHHGGIGTVQAAMRSGAPSIIAPFIADQPFWAARLEEAGLAPAPLRSARLTADTVTRALAAAAEHKPAVERAAGQMRQEDGTGYALDVLTALGGGRQQPAAPPD